MQVWNVLHAARWKCRNKKIAKNSPSGHHCTTLSGYIFATKACIDNRKNLLNSNISSTCPHNMVNFGQLGAEIVSLVWGTPANYNGFCILVSLLQWCHSTEANQTLHDIWPSPGLVHYTYTFFGGSFHVKEFCQVQHSPCVQVLHPPILAALLPITFYMHSCHHHPPHHRTTVLDSVHTSLWCTLTSVTWTLNTSLWL